MSILSIYEATPNRVLALTRLAAYLGPTTRAVLREHIVPGASTANQFNNLLRETKGLGLLEEASGNIKVNSSLPALSELDGEWFSLYLDKALLSNVANAGENRCFPYALSWLLIQPTGAAIPWNSDQHLAMQDQMTGDDVYDVTNEGRFSMLCYWARYLGYAAAIDIRGVNTVVPDPTEAVRRRLAGVFKQEQRLSVTRFLEALAKDCSVLEGGAARREVESRFHKKRSGNELSPATSLALWRLEAQQLIKIEQFADAETWLMSKSTAQLGAGSVRRVSHIDLAA